MARPFGRTLDGDELPQYKPEEEQLFASATLSKGMITVIDRANIPDEALSLAQNVRVRSDKTSRRTGTTLFAPAKPNGNPVLRLLDYKVGLTSRTLLRVAPPTIHRMDGAAWIALTGALTSGIASPIFIALVLDKLILANGVDKLQLINMDTNSFGDLSATAPRARFVTGAFNRVVCASIGDSIDGLITVAWSGDENFTVFDPAADISAGFSPIIDSPSDKADFITGGIFSFNNIIVLLRNSSVWLATKNPVASNPFNFFNAVPGIGCDIPSSVALDKDGLFWLDSTTRTVWAYVPGSAPEDIGFSITKELFTNFMNPERVAGAYYSDEQEYRVSVPQADGTRKLWIYNKRTKAWTVDLYDDIASLATFGVLSGYTSYDAAAGTYDAAVGTYDGASANPVQKPTMYIGKNNGDIGYEDAAVQTDYLGNYTMDIRSKEFFAPNNDVVVSKIKLEYTVQVNGQISLYYSKDGISWILSKTINTAGPTTRTQLLKHQRAVRCRRIMWRVVAVNGQYDFLNYEIRYIAGGESKK